MKTFSFLEDIRDLNPFMNIAIFIQQLFFLNWLRALYNFF